MLGFVLFCFLICFSLLAFGLLGFLASWLFGFLSFWLLGFLAFRLLVGLCGFWWLFGLGFSHPLHSQFLFGCRIRCFPSSCPGALALAPFHWFLGFGFPHHQHHRCLPLNHHEHHWGGSPPPTCYLDCLQSICTPI